MLGLALGTLVGTPRWMLGLVFGTPVGTPCWVLGLALGTPVGTPEWIESTVCTSGIVLCGCMFEFLEWVGSTVCTTGKSLVGCLDLTAASTALSFDYGCRLTLRFAFSWWHTVIKSKFGRRTLRFAFSKWGTLIKSKFRTEGFSIFSFLVSSEHE